MVCAIISDIHSNLEALTAVLKTIDELDVEVVYCLGDLVGYNADPDSCVEAVLSRAVATVRGNHDKAVAGLMHLEWFNAAAREAALWTRQHIHPATLSKVRALREGPQDVGEGILLCHGTPFDEDAYLANADAIAESYQCLDASYPGVRFCFHGHTHVPLMVSRHAARRKPRVLGRRERFDLEPGTTCLINPGAVGQPRDGIALASFGILDTNRLVYSNVRIAYGISETQRKILQAGLPPELARRLAEGR